MKRNLLIITMLVFVLSSSFMLYACAKKQVVTETLEEEVAEEKEPAEKPIEIEKATEEKEIATGSIIEEKPAVVAKKKDTVFIFDEETAYRERMTAQVEAESIYFDFNRSFIRPEYRPVLEKKAMFLKENPEYHIRIEGNCDERGTNEYNLALGKRRADSAKDYLVSLGIPHDRIATISYGEERPLAVGHHEAAWAQNRRNDFVLMKQ
jgi:peptidoglycan-associated lipoprotein